ncbi:MAG: hypothetical protein ACTSUE_11800 [Promethearchaeota archaeon]
MSVGRDPGRRRTRQDNHVAKWHKKVDVALASCIRREVNRAWQLSIRNSMASDLYVFPIATRRAAMFKIVPV